MIKICIDCSKPFSNTIIVDGVKYRSPKRLRCLNCSPFKSEVSAKRYQMTEEEWKQYQRQRRNTNAGNSKRRNPKLDAFRVLECRRNKKIALIRYKGGVCERCGYNKDVPQAYHFHHRDPDDKEFGISDNLNWSLERLQAEVDKCQLLCSLCHSEIHFEEDMAVRAAIMIKLGLAEDKHETSDR